MSVSVVVVTYRRLVRLEEILAAWLKETPDVWLCDCSREGFKTNLPIKIIRAIPDPGSKIRHAVTILTEGDLVIKADDDVMPKTGMVNDFIRFQKELGPAILGIHGRVFQGEDYYRQTRLNGSKEITAPKQVDFVGVMTCSPREFLAMDLRGCITEAEDLFWQMKCYPKVKKYIIPTDKFHHLQESKDPGRLCGTLQTRETRRKFYQEYYIKNYRDKK